MKKHLLWISHLPFCFSKRALASPQAARLSVYHNCASNVMLYNIWEPRLSTYNVGMGERCFKHMHRKSFLNLSFNCGKTHNINIHQF